MPVIWNDALLDEMRKLGDESADAVVNDLVAKGELPSANHLMGALVRNDTPPPAELPSGLIKFVNIAVDLNDADLVAIRKGQRLFAQHGHIILLVLICGSLPTAYAARKGVKVLKGTRFFLVNPNRRLWETAQMVVNVMTPGGLSGTGRGIRTAQKVRLMHAAIRHIFLAESAPAWDINQLGRPVNQEDLPGTLLLFSHFVLNGLDKLGVWVDPEEKLGYFRTWQIIGGIMGVRDDLIPSNFDEATDLNALIWKRQLAESEDGREMLGALLDLLKKDSPSLLSWLPGATIRYLLPAGAPDMIGVPKHRLGVLAVGLFARINEQVNRLLGPSGVSSLFFRRFGLRIVDWLIKVDRGQERAKFRMPSHLCTYWGVSGADDGKSFWRRWIDQMCRVRQTVTRVISSYSSRPSGRASVKKARENGEK